MISIGMCSSLKSCLNYSSYILRDKILVQCGVGAPCKLPINIKFALLNHCHCKLSRADAAEVCGQNDFALWIKAPALRIISHGCCQLCDNMIDGVTQLQIRSWPSLIHSWTRRGCNTLSQYLAITRAMQDDP